MALLANVLAITLSAVFNQELVIIPQAQDFPRSYLDKFGAINSTLSETESQMPRMDQFIDAVSNFTAGTSLPAWTDDQYIYVPFNDTGTVISDSQLFQVNTRAFGLDLDCFDFSPGSHSSYFLGSYSEAGFTFNATFVAQDGTQHVCSRGWEFNGFSDDPFCPLDGRSSVEFVQTWLYGSDPSSIDFCGNLVVAGWGRYEGENVCFKLQPNSTDPWPYPVEPWPANATIGSNNTFGHYYATVITCSVFLSTRMANVTVDINGRVQAVQLDNETDEAADKFLTNNFSNLYNRTVEDIFWRTDYDDAWHNDSVSGDWFNYFIWKMYGSDVFNVSLPPPPVDASTEQFRGVFRKMTAIWLGLNIDKLLVPANSSSPPLSGFSYVQESRIFLSQPPFIISETILVIYAVVIVIVYFRRLGRFLPRMPTTIGSIVAMFAASEALRDMQSTADLDEKAREKHIKTLRCQYKYGQLVGTDGELHVGIGKV